MFPLAAQVLTKFLCRLEPTVFLCALWHVFPLAAQVLTIMLCRLEPAGFLASWPHVSTCIPSFNQNPLQARTDWVFGSCCVIEKLFTSVLDWAHITTGAFLTFSFARLWLK